MTGRSLRKRKSVVDYAALINGSDEDETEVLPGSRSKNSKPSNTSDTSSEEFALGDTNDAAISEDDPMGEDGEDEDISVKPVKRNNPPSIVRVKTEPQAVTSNHNFVPKTTKASNKASANKSARAKYSSMKDRFRFFWGNNEQDFVEATKQRHVWSSELFSPLKELIKDGQDITRPSSFTGKLIDIPDNEYDVQSDTVPGPHSSEPLTICTNNNLVSASSTQSLDTVRLEPGGFTYTGDCRGLLLYVGGTVSSIAWAPGHSNSSAQYLAVSSSTCEKRPFDPVNVEVLSEENRAFGRGNSSTGVISLYSIIGMDKELQQQEPQQNQDHQVQDQNDNNGKGSLRVDLLAELSTPFGGAHIISWQPSGDCPSDMIGNMAVAGNDGKLHIIKVRKPRTAPLRLDISKSSLSVELESNILTLAWRNAHSIIVGTADGCIAEIDITDPQILEPSFYFPVASSAVSSISTEYPDGDRLVIITSTDGHTRMLDLKDPRRSIAAASRSTQYATSSAYSCHAKSFVAMEDGYTCKVISSQRMNTPYGNTGLARHDGAVACLATSLFHPFVLSGSTDGCLKMSNVIRRIMVNARKSSDQYSLAKLWKLDADYQQNLFRMSDLMEPDKFESIQSSERQILFPPATVVTTVDWNPNESSATWYAAGTACGLIRIESVG